MKKIKFLKNGLSVISLALLTACGGESDEAKKLGFSSADEMKEIHAQGWHTKEQYERERVRVGISDFNNGLNYYKNGDYASALNKWKGWANLGNADSQYGMGLIYDHGRGVSQDFRKAFEWYAKAAEQGHSESQYNIGVYHENGHGVSKDVKKAIVWYKKSADQGNVYAINRLAYMYSYGLGVPKNLIAAHALYSVSAMKGNKELQNEQIKVAKIISNPILYPSSLRAGQKLSALLYNIQALANSGRAEIAKRMYQRSSLAEALDDYVNNYPWVD